MALRASQSVLMPNLKCKYYTCKKKIIYIYTFKLTFFCPKNNIEHLDLRIQEFELNKNNLGPPNIIIKP